MTMTLTIAKLLDKTYCKVWAKSWVYFHHTFKFGKSPIKIQLWLIDSNHGFLLKLYNPLPSN